MSVPNEIIIGYNATEYHKATGRPWLTWHLLRAFLAGGFDAYVKQRDNPEPPGPAKVFGSAFHKLLEGRTAFAKEYLIGGPINPKTGKTFGRDTKAFQEWTKENPTPNGEQRVTQEEFDLLIAMAAAVENHPTVQSLLTCHGAHELTLRGMLFGLPAQSLVDYVRKPHYCLVDWKTCADVGDLVGDAVAYGYDMQLAFYRMLFREIKQIQPKCFLVGVDKQPQPVCTVLSLNQDWLYECEQKIILGITELSQFLRTE